MIKPPGSTSVCGISGRVRGVGLFGPLQKQFERLAILPGPLPQLRIRDRPGELQIARVCPFPATSPRMGVSFSDARRRNVKAF